MSKVRVPKVHESDILLALSRRHEKDLWLTQVRNGPSLTAQPGELRIMDGLGIARSWVNPNFHGYEVKVSRSDFVSDDKWPVYLSYCHQFSFACPKGLIQPEELPPEVGLIWYNPETRALSTRRRALKRPINISWEMLYYILISRTDPDRHPFFSDRADYFRGWLASKTEKRSIGHLVSQRLGDEIRQAEQRAREAELSAAAYRRDSETLTEIREVMKRHGIWTWIDSSLAARLDDALKGKVPPDLRTAVQAIARHTQEIERMLEAQEEVGA